MPNSFINPSKSIRFLSGLLLIAFFITISVINQVKYTLAPFLKSKTYIPYLLHKDDLSLLRELANPVYRVIEGINQYPKDTNFYFAQCFKDSGNPALDWWYLYIITRYLCFPRRIFCMHPSLYQDSKEEYLNKYIESKTKYSDLEWIKSRNIKYIILYRNNTVSIVPADSRIIL